MSSIDVLRLRINSIDKAIEHAKWQKSIFPQDREELCEQISGLRSERKATIKAIEALEKVKAIRDYCESTKKAYSVKHRDNSCDKRCFDLAADCFDAVIQEIDSLEKVKS